jgi:hypothetical protein
LDCANAIDEASIAASTIANVLRIAFPPRFQWTCAFNALYLGNEAGSPSFLQRATKVSVAAFFEMPIAPAKRFLWPRRGRD